MRFQVSIQRLTPTIIEQSVPATPFPDDSIGLSEERVPAGFAVPAMPVVPLRDPQRDFGAPLVQTVQARSVLPIDEKRSPLGIVYRREAVLPPSSMERVVQPPPATVRFDTPTEIDWSDLGAFEIPENWPSYAQSVAQTILFGGLDPIETSSGYRVEPTAPTRSLAQVYDSILSVRPLGDPADAAQLRELNNAMTQLLSDWSSEPIDLHAPAGDTAWVANALARLESALDQSDTIELNPVRYWNALQTYQAVRGLLEPYLADHLQRVWAHRYGTPVDRIRQVARYGHLLGSATGYAASLIGPYEGHSIRTLALLFGRARRLMKEAVDLTGRYNAALELLRSQEYSAETSASPVETDTSAIDEFNEYLIQQAQERGLDVTQSYRREPLDVEDLAMARLIYENLDQEDRDAFADDLRKLTSEDNDARVEIVRKYLFATGSDAAVSRTRSLSGEREAAQNRAAQEVLASPGAMASLVRSVLFQRYMERRHPRLRSLMEAMNATIREAAETGAALDENALRNEIDNLSREIFQSLTDDSEDDAEAVVGQDEAAEAEEGAVEAVEQGDDSPKRPSLSKQTILRNYVMDVAHLTGRIMVDFLFAARYAHQIASVRTVQENVGSRAITEYRNALMKQAVRRLGLVRLAIARMVATAGVAYVEQKVRNRFALSETLGKDLEKLLSGRGDLTGFQRDWQESGHHVWATRLKTLELSYRQRIGLLSRAYAQDLTSSIDHYLGRAVDAIAATAQQIMHWVENTPIEADQEQFADVWVARYQSRLAVVDEIAKALREALSDPLGFANQVSAYLSHDFRTNALRALTFGTDQQAAEQPAGQVGTDQQAAERARLIRARVGLVLTRAFMLSGLYNEFSRAPTEEDGSRALAAHVASLLSDAQIATLINSDPLVHQLAHDASLIGAFAPAAILIGRAIANAPETGSDSYESLIGAIWPEAAGDTIQIANRLREHAGVWIDALQTGLSWSLIRAAYGLGLVHWNALVSDRSLSEASPRASQPIAGALTVALNDETLKTSLIAMLARIGDLASKRNLPLLYQERYIRSLSGPAPYDDLERVFLSSGQGENQEADAMRLFRAKSIQDRLENLVGSSEMIALFSPEMFSRPFERNAEYYDAYSLANLFRLFTNHFAYSMHVHAHLLHRLAEQVDSVLTPDFGSLVLEAGASQKLALSAAALTLGAATSLTILMRRMSDEIARRYAHQLMDGAVSLRFRFIPWWSEQLHDMERGAATTQAIAKIRIDSYLAKVNQSEQVIDPGLIATRIVQSVNEQGFFTPIVTDELRDKLGSVKKTDYNRGMSTYAPNTPMFMHWYIELDRKGEIASGLVERRRIENFGGETPVIQLVDQSLHTDYRLVTPEGGDQTGKARAGVGTLIQAAIHYQTLRDAFWLSVLDGLESSTRQVTALASHMLNEPERYESTIAHAFQLVDNLQKFGAIDPAAVIGLMFPTPARAVDLTGLRTTGREGILLTGGKPIRLYSMPVKAFGYTTIDLKDDAEDDGAGDADEKAGLDTPLQKAFMVAIGVHHPGQEGSEGKEKFKAMVGRVYNDRGIAIDVSAAIETWRREASVNRKDPLDQVSVSDRHRWRGMLATMVYLDQLEDDAPQRKGRVVLLTDPNRTNRVMPWIVPPRLTIQTEVEMQQEDTFIVTRKVSIQVPVAYVIYYAEGATLPYIDVIYHRYPVRQFSESGQLDSYSVEFQLSDWHDYQKRQFYRSLLEPGGSEGSFQLSKFPVFGGLGSSGESMEKTPPAIADQTYLFEMVQRAHDLLGALFGNEFPSFARDKSGLRVPLDIAYQTFYIASNRRENLVDFLMREANVGVPASRNAIARNPYEQRDVLDRLLTLASIGHAPNAYTEYMKEQEAFGLFSVIRSPGAVVSASEEETTGGSEAAPGEGDKESRKGSGKRSLTIREEDVSVAAAVAAVGASEVRVFEPRTRRYALVYQRNPEKRYATRIRHDTAFEPQVLEQAPRAPVRQWAVRGAQRGLVSGLPGEFASSTALLNIHQNAHIFTTMLLIGLLDAGPDERADLIRRYGEVIDEYRQSLVGGVHRATLMQIADDYLRWAEKNGFDWKIALGTDDEGFVDLLRLAVPDVADRLIDLVRNGDKNAIYSEPAYTALKGAVRDALVDQMIYRGITDAFYAFVQHIVPVVGRFRSSDLRDMSPVGHSAIRRLFEDVAPSGFAGHARLIAEVGKEMALGTYRGRVNAVSVDPRPLAELMRFVYQAPVKAESAAQAQTQAAAQAATRAESSLGAADATRTVPIHAFLELGRGIIVALWRKYRMGQTISPEFLDLFMQAVKSLMTETEYDQMVGAALDRDPLAIEESWKNVLSLWDPDAEPHGKLIGLRDLYLTALSLKEAARPSDPMDEKIAEAVPPRPGEGNGPGRRAWTAIAREPVAGWNEARLADTLESYVQPIGTKRPAEDAGAASTSAVDQGELLAARYALIYHIAKPNAAPLAETQRSEAEPVIDAMHTIGVQPEDTWSESEPGAEKRQRTSPEGESKPSARKRQLISPEGETETTGSDKPATTGAAAQPGAQNEQPQMLGLLKEGVEKRIGDDGKSVREKAAETLGVESDQLNVDIRIVKGHRYVRQNDNTEVETDAYAIRFETTEDPKRFVEYWLIPVSGKLDAIKQSAIDELMQSILVANRANRIRHSETEAREGETVHYYSTTKREVILRFVEPTGSQEGE